MIAETNDAASPPDDEMSYAVALASTSTVLDAAKESPTDALMRVACVDRVILGSDGRSYALVSTNGKAECRELRSIEEVCQRRGSLLAAFHRLVDGGASTGGTASDFGRHGRAGGGQDRDAQGVAEGRGRTTGAEGQGRRHCNVTLSPAWGRTTGRRTGPKDIATSPFLRRAV
jgi:hypothetical protein